MRQKSEGGYVFFISEQDAEARTLWNIYNIPGKTKAFEEATGITAFGYIAKDAATNEPNRIRVEPDQAEVVISYMQSLGFKIVN